MRDEEVYHMVDLCLQALEAGPLAGSRIVSFNWSAWAEEPTSARQYMFFTNDSGHVKCVVYASPDGKTSVGVDLATHTSWAVAD